MDFVWRKGINLAFSCHVLTNVKFFSVVLAAFLLPPPAWANELDLSFPPLDSICQEVSGKPSDTVTEKVSDIDSDDTELCFSSGEAHASVVPHFDSRVECLVQALTKAALNHVCPGGSFGASDGPRGDPAVAHGQDRNPGPQARWS